jgi:acyl dehydratase
MISSNLVTDMAGLRQHVGARLGPTDWAPMTQEQVSAFAELTGDRNFIHVDPERAKQSPFGGTIAHGFLTLSLIAPVTQQLKVTDARTGINYGLDRVRFPAALPVGSRWRSGAEIVEVTELEGGAQVKMRATVEVEGREKPAVIAELLVRLYA